MGLIINPIPSHGSLGRSHGTHINPIHFIIYCTFHRFHKGKGAINYEMNGIDMGPMGPAKTPMGWDRINPIPWESWQVPWDPYQSHSFHNLLHLSLYGICGGCIMGWDRINNQSHGLLANGIGFDFYSHGSPMHRSSHKC
jgi:hypothetical protein